MFVSSSDGREHLLESLNVEQRAAVTHEGGPLLALAGAGTGKTTTLCSRLAWHVFQGVPPERLLLITFTRRAAREMLARARVLIPPDPAGSVVGGTFHSVAYQLICRHSAALGLPTKFSVADAADAAQLGTASVVQASGCRRDVTVFRLNAACAGDSGFEPTFRRNTAAPVYPIGAAHNPEVAGSNPAPAIDGLLRLAPSACRWLSRIAANSGKTVTLRASVFSVWL